MSLADTSSCRNHAFQCLNIGAPKPQLAFELLNVLSSGSWILRHQNVCAKNINLKPLRRNHRSFILLSSGCDAYGFPSAWGLVPPQEFFLKVTHRSHRFEKKQMFGSRTSCGRLSGKQWRELGQSRMRERERTTTVICFCFESEVLLVSVVLEGVLCKTVFSAPGVALRRQRKKLGHSVAIPCECERGPCARAECLCYWTAPLAKDFRRTVSFVFKCTGVHNTVRVMVSGTLCWLQVLWNL